MVRLTVVTMSKYSHISVDKSFSKSFLTIFIYFLVFISILNQGSINLEGDWEKTIAIVGSETNKWEGETNIFSQVVFKPYFVDGITVYSTKIRDGQLGMTMNSKVMENYSEIWLIVSWKGSFQLSNTTISEGISWDKTIGEPIVLQYGNQSIFRFMPDKQVKISQVEVINLLNVKSRGFIQIGNKSLVLFNMVNFPFSLLNTTTIKRYDFWDYPDGAEKDDTNEIIKTSNQLETKILNLLTFANYTIVLQWSFLVDKIFEKRQEQVSINIFYFVFLLLTIQFAIYFKHKGELKSSYIHNLLIRGLTPRNIFFDQLRESIVIELLHIAIAYILTLFYMKKGIIEISALPFIVSIFMLNIISTMIVLLRSIGEYDLYTGEFIEEEKIGANLKRFINWVFLIFIILLVGTNISRFLRQEIAIQVIKVFLLTGTGYLIHRHFSDIFLETGKHIPKFSKSMAMLSRSRDFSKKIRGLSSLVTLIFLATILFSQLSFAGKYTSDIEHTLLIGDYYLENIDEGTLSKLKMSPFIEGYVGINRTDAYSLILNGETYELAISVFLVNFTQMDEVIGENAYWQRIKTFVSGEGAIVSRSISAKLGIKSDDTIEFIGSENKSRVLGILPLFPGIFDKNWIVINSAIVIDGEKQANIAIRTKSRERFVSWYESNLGYFNPKEVTIREVFQINFFIGMKYLFYSMIRVRTQELGMLFGIFALFFLLEVAKIVSAIIGDHLKWRPIMISRGSPEKNMRKLLYDPLDIFFSTFALWIAVALVLSTVIFQTVFGSMVEEVPVETPYLLLVFSISIGIFVYLVFALKTKIGKIRMRWLIA